MEEQTDFEEILNVNPSILSCSNSLLVVENYNSVLDNNDLEENSVNLESSLGKRTQRRSYSDQCESKSHVKKIRRRFSNKVLKTITIHPIKINTSEYLKSINEKIYTKYFQIWPLDCLINSWLIVYGGYKYYSYSKPPRKALCCLQTQNNVVAEESNIFDKCPYICVCRWSHQRIYI